MPLREIDLSPTVIKEQTRINPPFSVYDTSGVYTDPDAHIDIRTGLPRLREGWIEERGDTDCLAAPTSQFGQTRQADTKLAVSRFPLPPPPPHWAKKSACVTQMHYARRGIITPEMEFIAIRENQRLSADDFAH